MCIFISIADEAPMKGEDFKKVLEDVESKIMPGVVHWNHPRFFAYFPSGNSYPSILGDMLSSALGSIGFSWVNIMSNSYKHPKHKQSPQFRTHHTEQSLKIRTYEC